MARATSSPRAPLLGAALLLLLLGTSGRQATGAPVALELRCQCLQTVPGVHPKSIQSVKVLAPGPHCTQPEVIAMLKDGREICLNPESPMVQKIIHKILNSDASS
uniref:growth-regulated protein homolog gamma n=1 Tax=Jaculus jaculus TaxID=51337 RepID=UPI001E1AF62C|nr:growth-regulated protein homolog gamma [Jaculus jaculus]